MAAPAPLLRFRESAREIAFFAVLLLLLALLRFPLATAPPVRDVDESVSALIASEWLAGGVPYRDAIDQRGPVTYALYALVFAVAGDGDMRAVHVALLLLVFAGCVLTFRLARRMWPARRAVAPLAALFLAIASFTYRPSQMLAFHTEWPIVLLSTLGMALVWRATRPGAVAIGRDLLLAGGAFGLSFLSKQPALFDGLAAGVFLLWTLARRPAPIVRSTLVQGGALAAGFVATVGLVAGYFAVNGALADFYLYFWSYNVEHYTAVVPVSERLRALDPFAHRRHYLTANPWLFAEIVGAAGLAFAEWLRRRKSPEEARAEPVARALVLLWFAAAYFGASYSGRNFGHYFIQILVPACLLAADFAAAAWELLGRRRLAGVLRAVLVLGGLAGIGFSLHRFGEESTLRQLGRPAERDETFEHLLARVRALTTPEQTIFVWGYHPEVYLLAPRRPATRYSNTNYLTGMLPWENHQPGVDTSEHIVPGSWEILMRELTERRPALVIDTVPGDHRYYRKYPIHNYPQLDRFLAEGYRVVEDVLDERGRPYYRLHLRNDLAF